jgi:type I restriction enzyme S subunit
MPRSIDAGIPTLPPAPPPDWTRAKVGDLFEVVERHVRLEPEKLYELVVARRNRGGIESRGKLNGRAIKVPQQFRVEADDFLLSNRQISHGGCGIVPAELSGAIVSGEYTVLHPKPKLLLDYLRYLTHTRYFQQICFHSSVGVHVEKLVFRPHVWMAWDIDLPSLHEQRVIARILQEADRVVATTEALIAAKREVKRGLAQTLLLAGERNTRFGEIAEINPRTSTAGADNVTFVPMESVSEEGQLLRATAKLRSELGPGFTPFQDGDTLVAKITPCFENGKGAFAAGLTNGVGLGSTEFHVVRATVNTHPRFLYHHTQTRAFRRNGERYMTGSAGQRRVPAEFIEEYRIPARTAEEQALAVSILDSATREIDLLAAQAAALRRQKRGLMQKLLTGEWRVGHPHEEAAE